VVNTDEGPKQPWTTEAEDFTLMRYTILEAVKVAEPRGILIGLEPHQQYSRSPEGLDRLWALVPSPVLGINFDTGNSYLCGHDPYAWLERVLDRLVHVHAKDISIEQADAERGQVTGTPVGCACGDGVIDWARVLDICSRAKRDLVLSVECGTIEQAERSIDHLRALEACA
jgi:sugar phosphate isomerase/epimerase